MSCNGKWYMYTAMCVVTTKNVTLHIVVYNNIQSYSPYNLLTSTQACTYVNFNL